MAVTNYSAKDQTKKQSFVVRKIALIAREIQGPLAYDFYETTKIS